MTDAITHEGNLIITSSNIEYANTISHISGSCHIHAEASLPVLAASDYRNVSGRIYIKGLVGHHHVRGEARLFADVDGSTMIIIGWKAQGDTHVSRALYFSGKTIDEMDGCYVAQRGDFTAHGDSAREAINDLNFKELSETRDKSEIVAGIIERQAVTINDYRLVTGACATGVRDFLTRADVDLETTDSLPLDDVLAMTADAYGGKVFASHVLGATHPV